jgi:hypothetical protein
MTPRNPQTALRRLANAGLAHADVDVVVRVALAVWYEGFVPKLGRLSTKQRRDVGYLVDRLARTSVLSKQQQDVLFSEVSKVRSSLRPRRTVSRDVHDPLAAQWGASADLSRFKQALLPLKTRHYRAGQLEAFRQAA